MASTLELILRTRKQGTAVKETAKDLTGLQKTLKGAATAFIALAATRATIQAAGKVWRAAIAGSEMLKAEKSFASMAESVGQDIYKISEAMQEASGGAVSMQDAMLMASQAIKLGVAETPEEFAKLTRASINLGAAMGRGPVDAMSDIVRGIGRMSPLILDNIGIVTNGGQVFDDYAESIGTTAAKLTDAEKKQALLNQAIFDGNNLVDAATTGYERLGVAGKDAGDRLKKAAGEALEPFADAIADALEKTNDFWREMDRLNESGVATESILDNFGVRTLAMFGIITDETRAKVKLLADSIVAIVPAGHEAANILRDALVPAVAEVEDKLSTALVLDIDIQRGLDALGRASHEIFLWSREQQEKLRLQVHIATTQERVAAGGVGPEERAGGGPVSAGRPYIVGEREAELFVPNQPGQIYNQQQLAGGDININTGIAQRAFNNMAEDWMRGLGG